MRTFLTVCLFSIVVVFSAVAQDSGVQPANTVCTLADGKQLSIQYTPAGPVGDKLPNGQPWQPGGKPVLLFTQAPLVAAGSGIPIGAFSIYLLPADKTWTLIVNRNVTAGSQYDQKQDITRLPMQRGQVGENNNHVKFVLVHGAPRQCNIRVYLGKKAGWAELQEK